MKFPYIEFPIDPSPAFPDRHSDLRPYIPILLKNGDKEFEITALVDSGASHCLFPQMLGIGLGLNVSQGPTQKIGGLGGKVITAHFHEITFQLGNVSWKAYVGFSPSALGTTGLLGHNGFFSRFKVIFDRSAACLIVRKRSAMDKILTALNR
jgi:hypothetical protein